jgi:next-to-BRCA1 protein 1
VNALSTALVGTTVAQLSVQLTQTALAAPTKTATPTATVTSLATIALPTLNSGAASPTTDVSALPTFSFVNTPIPGANTPVPGFTQVSVLPTSQATASLGDACNNNVFEGDVTIPDGTILKPGEDFVKIWAVRNTGNCTWDEGYALIFIAGNRDIDPIDFKFKKASDFVSPGEGVNLGIPLTAPLAEGKYEGHWRMQSDSGFYFGTILSVYIEVKKP